MPMGGTFPGQAVKIALSLSPDAVYLLSDGQFQDNTAGMLQTWNPDRPKRGKISIHTIALGAFEGEGNMKFIADRNNGIFKAIN